MFIPSSPLLRPHTSDTLLHTLFLLTPLLGAFLSFLSCDYSQSSTAWRRSLHKSRCTPPAFVSAITWIILYPCMGHASFVAYRAQSSRSTVLSPCLATYLTQCMLNHFFIIVLFGLQRVDLALLIIVPLWLATLLTTVLFFEVAMEAGLWMVPVLVWVTFNVYLNLVLFLWNPVYTSCDLKCSGCRVRGVCERDAVRGKTL